MNKFAENLFYTINYKFSSNGIDELQNALATYHCDIEGSLFDWFDESEENEKLETDSDGYFQIGKLTFFHCKWNLARDEWTPYEILDYLSETSKYKPLLNYTLSYETYSDEVNEILGDDRLYPDNLLIFHRLEILPKFRGMQLGLKIMKDVCKVVGQGLGIAALTACPLQFDTVNQLVNSEYPEFTKEWYEQMKFTSLPTDKKASAKKLEDYYSKIGFEKVGDDGLMIVNLAYRYDLEDEN